MEQLALVSWVQAGGGYMTSQGRFTLSGPPSIVGQPGLWQFVMPCAVCYWYVSVPVLWLPVPAAEYDAGLCAYRYLPACDPTKPHRLQGQGEPSIQKAC